VNVVSRLPVTSVWLLLCSLAWLSLGCANTGVAQEAPHASKPTDRTRLYLLIGQSNMAGRGKVSEQDRTAHPRVMMLDRSGQWVPAVEPVQFDKPFVGVGPGLAFGKAMAQADPGVIIGLIPAAAGGSPIRVWQAGEYWKQTDSHPYDDAIRRTKAAQQHGQLAGILWHQGEADSGRAGARAYAQRLDDLIARLRTDLDAPDVPVLVGGMSDGWIERKPAAATLNEALATLPDRVAHTAFAPAEGLTLKDDGVHFNAESARALGRRFARAMQRLHAAAAAVADNESEAKP